MLISVFKGAGKVAAGTAAGQGVVLIATPFLARQYSPSEFGSLALLLTISNIASALACFRYDLTIAVASKNESSALFLIAIAGAVTSSVAVVSLLGIGFFLPNLALSSNISTIWIIGLCVLLVGIQQAVIGILTHERGYAEVAMVRLGQGGMFASLAIFPSMGLLFAHAFSFVVAIPFAVRNVIKAQVTFREIRRTAYERRSFPFLSLPGAVLDVIGYSAVIWIMVYFYGAAETGQYSQIQRIVGAPLMLLGMSISQVLLRSSADLLQNQGGLLRLFRQLCYGSLLVGLLTVFAIALVGEPLLDWLLGSKWHVETVFVVPIAIAVTIRACVSPLSSLLISLQRFDLALRWQVIYFLSSVLVFTTAAISLSFDYFIIIYAIHEICLYGLYLGLISNAVRNVKCVASSV